MKKKILLIIIAVIVMSIAITMLTSFIMYYGSIVGKPNDDRNASYVDERKELNKKVIYDGKEYSVAYKKTRNRLPTVLSKVTSKYNAIDIYYDEEGREFDFYYNTNELCGMFKGIDKIGDKKISTNEAVEIAKNVLKDYIDVDQYFVELSGLSGNSYSVKLTKKICSILTNDSASVTINIDGKVIGFSIFDTNRYDEDKISSSKIQSVKDFLTFQIKLYTGKDIDIYQERIIANEKGNALLEIKTSNGNTYTGVLY